MYMILPVLPSIGPIQYMTGLAFATKKARRISWSNCHELAVFTTGISGK
jgi:ABC-type transport system involved in cytochrome c biogenesis permease subunit